MPIATTDLQLFASANMPDTDTGTNGGAIDTLRRLAFTQMAANDTVQIVSSSAGDTTQTVTIEARTAAGAVISDTRTLSGTTPVAMTGLGTVERILKAEMSATAAGTVTVRRTTGPVTIGTIAIGERGFMALFRKISSDPSVVVNRYTKGFWKNTHATLALLTAVVKQSADPSAKITHVLAAAVNDAVTATDRTTAPTGTFDDTDKAVPGTDLAAGSAIGTWWRAQLTAGDSPYRTTYDSQISGSSV